jgi:hypothetical protein
MFSEGKGETHHAENMRVDYVCVVVSYPASYVSRIITEWRKRRNGEDRSSRVGKVLLKGPNGRCKHATVD